MKKMPTLSLINNNPSNDLLFDTYNDFGQESQPYKPNIEMKNNNEKSFVSDNEADYYEPGIKEKIIFELGDIGFDIYGNPIHWK